MSSRDAGAPPVAAWHPPELGGVVPAATTEVVSDASEDARRTAWLEGHAAAMSERDNELDAAVTACRAIERAMQETAERLRAQVSSTVHALSVAIARHLLERELTQDPAAMQRLVARALTLAPMNGIVTVRLHPADLAAIQSVGGMPDPGTTGVDLRWMPDESVLRGGCLVEGPSAIIDGRIDRALLDIYEQISHD